MHLFMLLRKEGGLKLINRNNSKGEWSAKLLLSLLGMLFFLFVLAFIFLPNPLFKDPYSAVLLSSEGELLSAKISSDEQWRFPLTEDVPEKYEKTLLAFEDKRFYQHNGIDPLAMLRAFYINLKYRQIKSGGSTITMQVVRLFRGNKDRTIFEKLIEVFMSLALEAKYSKKEILTLYAGHTFFGGNVVGLSAASWRYFGRSPGELSWAESALMAVLPNSPALIHPGKNRELLKKKRDQLLKKLLFSKLIQQTDYQLALAEPIPLKPLPLPQKADHLLQTIISQKHGKIYSILNSTIKISLQDRVARIIEEHYQKSKQRGIHNLCAVVMDNQKSSVIAYIGNISVLEKLDKGENIDIIRRPRSTGSILKPLLYLSMLKDGEILSSTLIPDIPTQYQGYIPENFDRQYRGAIPAKQALAYSLNIPAVRLLKKYGVHRFYDFLKLIGMTTLKRSADDYGLTIVLGGAEGTLWDISCIYANLAQLVNRQTMTNIRFLKDETVSKKEVSGLGPGSVYLTLEALVEVNRPDLESYWRSFKGAQKIAWKTGTSYGFKDAWAIGVTPKYTVGVWAGNSDGEGRPDLTGLAIAAPVLFDIFNALDKSDWFPVPYEDLKEVEVCQESGYIATDACSKKKELAPFYSHFTEISPYHILVHLDHSKKYQVNSQCESPKNMVHLSYFVLPPVIEFYYKKYHPEYKVLPSYRKDCEKKILEEGEKVMSLFYPHLDTVLYIPIGLDGKLQETVFKAAHRKPDTTIFWHLDEEYLGQTRSFHEKLLQPSPGKHVLLLIDENGNKLTRRFEVLGKEKKSNMQK